MADNHEKVQEDVELEVLMQSALEEMWKSEKKASEGTTTKDGTIDPEVTPTEISSPGMLTEDFFRETAQRFETDMAALFEGHNSVTGKSEMTEEKITSAFNTLTDVISSMSNLAVEPDDEDRIKEILKSLSADLKNVEQAFTDEDLVHMFSSLLK